MSDKETTIFIASVIINITFFMLFMSFSGSYYSEKDIIEHGCAKYNSQTGEFEWKEKK